MADDDFPNLDPLAGILTPQMLQLQRQAQMQQALAQASAQAPNGQQYGNRALGLTLGSSIGQALSGRSPLDQLAQQNQQILNSVPTPASNPAPPGVPGSAASPDMYMAYANYYQNLAQRFQAAGNSQAAAQMMTAAMAIRSRGQKAAALAAQTSQMQASAEDQAAKAEAAKADAQYVVVDSSPGPDGLPRYRKFGDSFSPYNDQGLVGPQAFSAAKAAAFSEAKAQGAQSPVLVSVKDFENSKAQAAAIRAQAQALKATQPSMFADDPGALDQLTGAYALHGASALTRMPAADRAAVIKNLYAKGLTYADASEAQLQYAALQHAINTGATRTGQVAFLSNEIPGQAQNVLDALNGVDRTRVQAVNGLIASGKTQFGDANEARYATALQGLLSPYARLIAGATGVTSDAARNDAYAILSKQQSPDQVKAVIDQIVNRELTVARQAGEGVIEMARSSTRYSALRKVAEKLGVPVSQLGGDPDTVMGPAVPSLGSPATAPPSTAVPRQAPPTAIAYLRAHPEAAGQFKAKYGYLPTPAQLGATGSP